MMGTIKGVGDSAKALDGASTRTVTTGGHGEAGSAADRD